MSGKNKIKTPVIQAMAVVIDGELYRCEHARSCTSCAFVDDCYAIPRKKWCPRFGGCDIGISANLRYRRIKPENATMFAITDGAGTYYQGGIFCTDYEDRATLFRSEVAAESVRIDLEQRLHHGKLKVVPVNIGIIVKGAK